MVRPQTPGRKELFEAALKLAGLTVEEWCDLPEYGGGLSRQHVGLVLKGERAGQPTIAKIDRFIAEQAPRMIPLVATAA